jgi:hypothetical protein
MHHLIKHVAKIFWCWTLMDDPTSHQHQGLSHKPSKLRIRNIEENNIAGKSLPIFFCLENFN